MEFSLQTTARQSLNFSKCLKQNSHKEQWRVLLSLMGADYPALDGWYSASSVSVVTSTSPLYSHQFTARENEGNYNESAPPCLLGIKAPALLYSDGALSSLLMVRNEHF